jgi:hypothetical protein
VTKIILQTGLGLDRIGGLESSRSEKDFGVMGKKKKNKR